MKPKSRKDILNICQNNFGGYSLFTKVMIIISVLLSSAALGVYVAKYVFPIICGIINGDIVGIYILLKICLIILLYIALRGINLFLVSVCGASICMEEKWDTIDFAKAWLNMYKYEVYFKNDKSDEIDNSEE